jgi:hypothetical protein
MKTIYKKLIPVILLILFSNHAVSATSNCDMKEYKKLYMALQDSLNYEGKDAYIDPKDGKVKLTKEHKGEDYNGKLFEDALFTQYQNALTKVANLYKMNLSSDLTKANPNLVQFFKALDPQTKQTDFTKLGINLDEFLNSFDSIKEIDEKFKLNPEDKYLLKNLLIHSQDKICSVDKALKNSKNPNPRDMNISKSPLNRMIMALRKANIKTDTKLELRDDKGKKITFANQEVTIRSAVMQNLEQLKKWLTERKGDKACLNKIKNKGYIQAGIQACNYNRFLDSIFKDQSNIEILLNYINANQKKTVLGETNIDPMKLEHFIDVALTSTDSPASCHKIDNETFLQNLKYNDKTGFDLKENKISCKSKDKIVNCANKITLESDALGRGIHVKYNNPKDKIEFLVADKACSESPQVDEGAIDPPTLIVDNKEEKECKDKKGTLNKDETDPAKRCVIPEDKLAAEEKACKDKKGTFNKDETDPAKRCVIPEDKLAAEEKACKDKKGTFNKDETDPAKRCVIPEDKLAAEEKACKDKKGTYNKDETDPAKRCVIPEDKLAAEEKACKDKKGTFNKDETDPAKRCVIPEDKLAAEEKACKDKKGTFNKDETDPAKRCVIPEDKLAAEEKACNDKKGTFNKDETDPAKRCVTPEDSLAAEEKACKERGNKYVFDSKGEGPTERCHKKPEKDTPPDRFDELMNSTGPIQTGTANPQYQGPQIPTRQVDSTSGLN